MWPCVPVSVGGGVGGGGFFAVEVVSVAVSVEEVVAGGPFVGGVVVSVDALFIGVFCGSLRGRRTTGCAGGAVGNVDAIVPGLVVAVVDAVFGNVKFVVVSTFVAVIGGVVAVGVSPGALIVDVTPLADPSSTTSYCC